MPTYEYRCERGHTFEVVQRMVEDALTSCSICGAPVQRVFHPVAVHFKGSGFYTNDYGKNKKGASEGSKSGSGGDSSKASDSSKSSSKAESSGSSKSSSSSKSD